MLKWSLRRVIRQLNESPVILASLLTLLCTPLVIFLVWIFVGNAEQQRVDNTITRQRVQLQKQLDEAEQDFSVAFTQLKNMTAWLARDPSIIATLAEKNRTNSVSPFLRNLVDAFGIDLIYVVNANGLGITASSLEASKGVVGEDYSYRDYFQNALKGKTSREFSFGRTTGAMGFFFSAPVGEQGKPQGVVVLKINQTKLMRLVPLRNHFITDDMGVVVVSHEMKHLNATLPDAPVLAIPEAQRKARYGDIALSPLKLERGQIAQYPDVSYLDGEPILIAERVMKEDGLRIYAYANVDVLADFPAHRRFLLVISCVMGIGFLWAVWVAVLVVLRSRDYRLRLEHANNQLSHLNNELQEQATHDYLTGCLNRRAFTAVLRTELDRTRRYSHELSLAVLDIDYFKKVNDSYGHLVGDKVLQTLAHELQAKMRKSDYLARIGGEEFALLMPNTPAAEAVSVVDRMRQIMGSKAIDGITPPLMVTFSAGVAGFDEANTPEELIRLADEALYAAKASGRNMVVMAHARRQA